MRRPETGIGGVRSLGDRYIVIMYEDNHRPSRMVISAGVGALSFPGTVSAPSFSPG